MDLNQIEPIARLINEFSKLPSVGRKSAERYAYHIIRSSDEGAKVFAESILNVKAKIKFCEENAPKALQIRKVFVILHNP